MSLPSWSWSISFFHRLLEVLYRKSFLCAQCLVYYLCTSFHPLSVFNKLYRWLLLSVIFVSECVFGGGFSEVHLMKAQAPDSTAKQCHLIAGASPGQRTDEDYRKWSSILHPRIQTESTAGGSAKFLARPSKRDWRTKRPRILEGDPSSKSLPQRGQSAQDEGLGSQSQWPPVNEIVYSRWLRS